MIDYLNFPYEQQIPVPRCNPLDFIPSQLVDKINSLIRLLFGEEKKGPPLLIFFRPRICLCLLATVAVVYIVIMICNAISELNLFNFKSNEPQKQEKKIDEKTQTNEVKKK